MKISCQSCQAKYTIADEKVLGKIVKIRCKKCGATIVINGNESEAATQAFGDATQVGGAFDYAAQGASTSEGWTVNVADGDQRTMTLTEAVSAFRSGVVNEETFCWKDGMSDWLPLRDVPEIVAALAEHPIHTDEISKVDAPPSASPPPSDQAGFSSLFGGTGSSGNAGGSPLFGGGVPSAPVSSPTGTARRAGGRGGGGADLFGTAATAGGEEDVMTSASANPQMVPGGDKRTGERNENSVLFSLSALTENAPKDDMPMAQGEGSGLIDIRALSTSMKQDGPKQNKVDDIMNLSGGGAFSAALAAPVLAPPSVDHHDASDGSSKKSNTALIVGLAAVIVLGLLGISALFILRKPDTIAAAPSASSSVAMNPSTSDSASPTTGTTAPGTATPVATTAAPAITAKAPNVGVGNGNGGSTAPAYKPPTNNNNTPAATPAFVPPPPAAAACDLACQMAKSAGAKPSDNTGATAAPSAASFDRGQAASSLGAISSNLGACKKGDGPTGSGHVKVTFNPNGNVASVDVDTPPYAGTSVGGCVAAKFRGARVSPFAGAPVVVGKSFAIN